MTPNDTFLRLRGKIILDLTVKHEKERMQSNKNADASNTTTYILIHMPIAWSL